MESNQLAGVNQSDSSVQTTNKIQRVCGWPTKTFALDFVTPNNTTLPPHTVLVFIPGNPGLVEWYIRSFIQMLLRLGPGYAVRGISNAGHAIESQLVRPRSGQAEDMVAWTIDGQVRHKASYMDQLLVDFPSQEFVFVSHSIGAFFTQRLCVSRPDILARTKQLLHVTPFLRMGAPWLKQTVFDFIASMPRSTICMGESLTRLLQSMPLSVVDNLLSAAIPDESSRKVTTMLLRQPSFCESFFQLGLREILEVPRHFDLASLRILDKECHTAVLVAGDDHWCPKYQADELQFLIDAGKLKNMSVQFDPNLRHGYVLDPRGSEQIVVEFCVKEVKQLDRPRSKL